MTKGPDPIDALLSLAERQGGLKLWSLIVTIMGDLSQQGAKGAEPPEISGLVLAAIVERLGLQPQAMRVALHRLKSDGWVESRRVGRVGYHRLSARGLTETKAVWELVYGPNAPDPGPLWLVVRPDGADASPTHPALPVARGTSIVAASKRQMPADWVVTQYSPETRPDWLSALVAEAGCHDAMGQIDQMLTDLLAAPAPTDPLERKALRAILLHVWRVAVLRANRVALALSLMDAPPQVCRAKVLDWLNRLGPPAP